MRLSIITPTLNPGPKLEQTIQSVLSQNFKDLEHLIIDGGSSDDTLNLIRKYDHLRLLDEGDMGIFDAMNKGIAEAKGEWLYFLGADDTLADEKVFSDLAAQFGENYDVLYGDVISSRFGGRYDGPFDARKIRKQNICHQAVFFRRQLFNVIGKFNLAYLAHADWDHNMRWLLNPTVRSLYVDRIIAHYADGGFSSTHADPNFKRDRIFCYLSYGNRVLPRREYWALCAKELMLGMRYLDLPRIRRLFQLVIGKVR